MRTLLTQESGFPPPCAFRLPTLGVCLPPAPGYNERNNRIGKKVASVAKSRNALAKYKQPSVAVDLAIFTIETRTREGRGHRPMLPEYALQVLLVQRGQGPFKNHWALPGGFVHEDEPLEHAAERELREETTVGGFALRHMANYSSAGRDPRGWVISAAYCALVKPPLLPKGGSDAAEARLWDVQDIADLPLAFDHGAILADARRWTMEHLLTTLAVREFLPEEFVLAELYGVLHAATGYTEEPGNFRRKVIGRGIVTPTGAEDSRFSRRPAQLYRFTGEVPSRTIF